MALAIPAADQAVILDQMNGRAATPESQALYDTWIVIGHEKDRPEINGNMYGFCGALWADYVARGTLR